MSKYWNLYAEQHLLKSPTLAMFANCPHVQEHEKCKVLLLEFAANCINETMRKQQKLSSLPQPLIKILESLANADIEVARREMDRWYAEQEKIWTKHPDDYLAMDLWFDYNGPGDLQRALDESTDWLSFLFYIANFAYLEVRAYDSDSQDKILEGQENRLQNLIQKYGISHSAIS